ncbi:MAG TPA: DUF305 domain-containing protein [Ilumatobacter sp.]|nr:DUF305 domain-containing protein [Ilumatobacter sp.]
MTNPTGSSPDLSLDQIVELERRAHERELAELAADGDVDNTDDHDTLVLPWWQRPFNIGTILVTAALLAGMIGWLIGDSGAQVKHGEVDTGFLHDMREHHEQAVLMGFIFREVPDTDDGLAVIAASIIQGQSVEVGRMIQLLRDFGEDEAGDGETAMLWMGMSASPLQMPGMASEEQLDQLLGSSGRQADELFVELMTAHHLGGIEMAEYAAENAENDQVRKMATSMADSQRHEIAELAGRLAP